MSNVKIRFQDELNDFLGPGRKGTCFDYPFTQNPSVKHLIEALGVPHTEVGDIRVNGRLVGFDYQAQPGDQIEVFPAVPSNDIPERPETHFVLDNHLGQLAVYLRILGFDTLYRNDYQDDELAQVASQEGRILLTRDRRLLMRKIILHGYCIRSLDPRQQVGEVLKRFSLFDQSASFQRCLRCNTPLQPVSKQEVLERLEPLTKLYYEEFRICTACDQVYWKGSHYEHMQDLIETVTHRNTNG